MSSSLKSLSVELQDSGRRRLASGYLDIPADADQNSIHTAISRIHSYSGSSHIGGYRVSLSIVDRPPAAAKQNEDPAPTDPSALDSKQKDQVIELAKQESKDKDAVIEDLRAQIRSMEFDLGGSPKKKVSTGKSAAKKPVAKNSKTKTLREPATSTARKRQGKDTIKKPAKNQAR